MQRIPFTKEGYEKLQKEFNELTHSRPAAVQDLKKAREMGDLSENGYYKAARWKLSGIDSRLRRLKYLLKAGQITKSSSSDTVGVGSTVDLLVNDKEVTYQIVSKFEANPKEGKISGESPLGSALLGKKVTDHVTVTTQKGKMVFQIIDIH